MVSGFIIENQTTKQRCTFGFNPNMDYVYKENGLDWGYAPASHSTYFYPQQVGENISVTNVTGRDITFTGYVHYIPTVADRSNYDKSTWETLVHEKIKEKKKILNALINPMDYLKITVGNFYLEGKPSRSVQYGDTRESNNEWFCMFVINIYCPNPMFHKVVAPNTIISGSSPGWHFPLSIPDTGFKFSTRVDYLVISVENEGDTSVGGIITLTAEGEVINPTIENIETGESLTVYKTMVSGEVIEIDTRQGSVRGIKGGIGEATSNYFQYWDFENDWVQFGVGSVLVGYSADSSTESLLNVKIEIRPEKYGLEEQ